MYNVKKSDFPYTTKDTIKWKPSGYDHKVYENILHTIGNTPLVRLNRIPKDHGLQCEMYAKCEFLNPGGSIKDRISYTMMVEAEKCGIVSERTRFIEPTSGNTGIGVALAAAVNGYKCTIVTPDKNSDEKMNTIRLLGADIVQTPSAAPYDGPESFVSVAKDMLRCDPDATSLDQYSNHVNPMTHYEYTANELLSTLGNIDMVVMGAGTGGTVSGVAHKVKEKCPHCVIVAVDPKGSQMFDEGEWKQYFVEGIGGDFIPLVFDKSVVDKVVKPDDRESFNMAREVIKKEGLLCGGSSGAAVFSAIKAAKDFKFGAGKRIVVILPDGIRNYMTKFVSDQWMESHQFKEPPPREYLMWWNRHISNLKIISSVPRIHENKSCDDALAAMGNENNVVLATDENGLLTGVMSKDSLRHEATNPKKETKLNLKEPVNKHLIKKYHKIIVNKGKPTIGLASRILDIAPFVVVVEEYHNKNQEGFIPKGIITPELMLQYIIEHQNNL